MSDQPDTMAATQTPNFGLNLPDIGGDWDIWGNETNDNWSFIDSTMLPIYGGAMTGLLTLYGNPTAALGAATKQYVDGRTPIQLDAPNDGNVYGRYNFGWTQVLSVSGGTLYGPLILNGAPTVNNGAATKQYVDGRTPITQDAPAISGNYYGRYLNGWVQVLGIAGGTLQGPLAVAAPGISFPALGSASASFQFAYSAGGIYAYVNSTAYGPFLMSTGGTMTGPLTLAADPTTALQAATRQYVDNNAPVLTTQSGGTVDYNAIDTTRFGLHNYGGPMTSSANGPPSVASPAKSTVLSAYSANSGWASQLFMGAAEDAAGLPSLFYREMPGGGTWNPWHRIITDAGGTLTGSLTLDGGAGLAVLNFDINGYSAIAADNSGDMQITCSSMAIQAPVEVSSLQCDGAATVGGPLSLGADPTTPTQAATKSYVDAATAASSGATNVGRNHLHNPFFLVAQRGVGPWTVNGQTLDRWIQQAGGGTTTDTLQISQVALTDADRTAIGDEYAEVAVQAAFIGTSNGFCNLSQRTEDVRRLGGKTVTVSFWAKATGGTSPRVGIGYQQNFGSGGSGGVPGNIGTTAALGASFQRYQASIEIPTTIGKTLGTTESFTAIMLFFSNGQNDVRGGPIGMQSDTVVVWGVQCEVASAATPMEPRDPALDFMLCQKFCLAQSVLVGATGAPTAVWYPETMRVPPTITGGGAGFAASNVTGNSAIVSQTAAAVQNLIFAADL